MIRQSGNRFADKDHAAQGPIKIMRLKERREQDRFNLNRSCSSVGRSNRRWPAPEVSMITRSLLVLSCLALLAGAAPAAAQATTGATPDDPAAAAAPAQRMRARTPRPAQVVLLTNATKHTAKEVVITGEDQTAKLTKPLAPKARASLKMPKLKSCTVSVSAVFEGEGQVDIGNFDICKDKTIRFTD
jgi:hypothetical protein